MIAPFKPVEILNNCANPINKTTCFPCENFSGNIDNILSILSHNNKIKRPPTKKRLIADFI